MIEITSRELYNILVEEKFTGGSCVINDKNYLKLKIPSGITWPLFDTHKFNLVREKTETIKVNCFTKDDNPNSDWLQLDVKFESFISTFPPILHRINLPAAITEQIFLGSKPHVSIENIKSLGIKMIISGEFATNSNIN